MRDPISRRSFLKRSSLLAGLGLVSPSVLSEAFAAVGDGGLVGGGRAANFLLPGQRPDFAQVLQTAMSAGTLRQARNTIGQVPGALSGITKGLLESERAFTQLRGHFKSHLPTSLPSSIPGSSTQIGRSPGEAQLLGVFSELLHVRSATLRSAKSALLSLPSSGPGNQPPADVSDADVQTVLSIGERLLPEFKQNIQALGTTLNPRATVLTLLDFWKAHPSDIQTLISTACQIAAPQVGLGVTQMAAYGAVQPVLTNLYNAVGESDTKRLGATGGGVHFVDYTEPPYGSWPGYVMFGVSEFPVNFAGIMIELGETAEGLLNSVAFVLELIGTALTMTAVNMCSAPIGSFTNGWWSVFCFLEDVIIRGVKLFSFKVQQLKRLLFNEAVEVLLGSMLGLVLLVTYVAMIEFEWNTPFGMIPDQTADDRVERAVVANELAFGLPHPVYHAWSWPPVASIGKGALIVGSIIEAGLWWQDMGVVGTAG